MATFEFLRLSLSVPRMGPLDATADSAPSDSREDYIRYLFSQPHSFFFRLSLFSYVPVSSKLLPPYVLAGRIGKRTEKLKMQGPEQEFVLAPAKEWNASFLVVDVRPDEQVVAIERRTDVGTSHGVLEHFFASKLTEYQKTAWHVDIEYISRSSDFFAVAQRYYGQLTELSFTFHPPNGLRGFERFKELDRIGKDQTNADESEYALKNKKGNLNPKGEFVESALDYASEGAGVTKLKAGKKVVFNSRDHKETLEVSEEMMPRQGEEIKVAGTAKHLLMAHANRSNSEDNK